MDGEQRLATTTRRHRTSTISSTNTYLRYLFQRYLFRTSLFFASVSYVVVNNRVGTSNTKDTITIVLLQLNTIGYKTGPSGHCRTITRSPCATIVTFYWRCLPPALTRSRTHSSASRMSRGLTLRLATSVSTSCMSCAGSTRVASADHCAHASGPCASAARAWCQRRS